jgi:hypothetical protein
MNVRVKRLINNGETTLGKLYIDNVLQCYTLEDQPNPAKVYGETRIPAGKYEIKLRTVGTIHEDYKKRVPEMHKGTLWLQDVPGFEFILIHIGNDDSDTLGCLLVGNKLSKKGWILEESTIAYKRIYPLIANELSSGKQVFITVEDET